MIWKIHNSSLTEKFRTRVTRVGLKQKILRKYKGSYEKSNII